METFVEIIKFMGIILGVVTAIFAFIKAYIEVRKRSNSHESDSKEGNMGTASNNSSIINTSKNKGNINITISGEQNKPQSDFEDNNIETTGNSANITLNKTYTSLFAEENRLKTEQIVITKQKGDEIEGIVTLHEKDINGNEVIIHKYTLKGKYLNKVLTAEYTSQNKAVDERGAINLKLIDQSILSGFCSFSKLAACVDDEIRVSPYVWVSGENLDLLNGTFDFCSKCSAEHEVCCCANPNVDMPVFLNNELDLIRQQIPTGKTDKNIFSKAFSKPYNNSSVRQMKRVEKKNPDDSIIYTKCHFFDWDEQKCKIYNGRPIDCRLFPYDIRLSDDKKEYVIGYYTTLCSRNLPDLAIMKKKAHILRPYFFLLYPYLHITTSEEACHRLNSAEFREISTFKDFVF